MSAGADLLMVPTVESIGEDVAFLAELPHLAFISYGAWIPVAIDDVLNQCCRLIWHETHEEAQPGWLEHLSEMEKQLVSDLRDVIYGLEFTRNDEIETVADVPNSIYREHTLLRCFSQEWFSTDVLDALLCLAKSKVTQPCVDICWKLTLGLNPLPAIHFITRCEASVGTSQC